MWGITISLYLFLAGVSAGAFAIALLSDRSAPADELSTLGKASLLVTRIGSLAAAIALVLELCSWLQMHAVDLPIQ